MFVTPDTGSALEVGQGLLTGFLFDDEVAASVPALCPAWVSGWLLVTVLVEVFDPRDEDEFER